MSFTFKPISQADVWAFAAWRYQPPYDVYNEPPPEEGAADYLAYFLEPDYHFHAVYDERDELVAVCSFGPDGQVPGGDYRAEGLDIGLGVRPDLTGQGRGAEFVRATVDFALTTFRPALLRVTIAAFNRRACRVWQRAGFKQSQTFRRAEDEMEFVILVRAVGNYSADLPES